MPIIKTERIRKDGTTQVGFRADGGIDPLTKKRIRKRFTKRADAAAWLKNQPGPAEQGKTGLSLADIGEDFVKDREAVGREKSTWLKYKEHFKNHINAAVLSDGELKGQTLGALDVALLRPRHLVQFRADLTRTRSHAMAKKVWATLRQALDYAVSIEATESNPALSVKLDRKPRIAAAPEHNAMIPPRKHIKMIREELLPDGPLEAPRLGQVYLLTILACGLRPSECKGLSISKLTLDGAAPKITVANRVDQWNQAGPPKSASGWRDVPMPAFMVQLYRRWLAAMPKPPKGEDWSNDLLFPTSAGHHQQAANIHNRVWVPLMRSTGLVTDEVVGKDEDGWPIYRHRYPVYSLRHAYASIQIDLGIKPKTLQVRMGHASIKQTWDTYGHLFDQPDRDAADMEALERWFATA
jgi:integrase